MGDSLRNLFAKLIRGVLAGFIILSQALNGISQNKNEVLIVGDVSGSMQGFALASPRKLETIYQIMVRNSKGLSTSTLIGKMPGKDSNGNFVPVQNIPDGNISIFSNTRTYVGQVTPLAEVINQKTSEQSSVMLLTDGVESDNLYLRLQEALIQLTKEGWGIWILLLPLEFDGKLDIEQPIIPELHLPQITECIKNQGAQASINPKATRTLELKGTRALLLFVLEKDVNLGRQRVELLYRDFLSELSESHAVEISPLYLREYTVTSVTPKSLGVQHQLSGAQTIAGAVQSEHKIVADPDDGEIFKNLHIELMWRQAPGKFPQSIEEKWLLNKELSDWSSLQIQQSTDPESSPGSLSLTINSERTWIEWLGSFFSSNPSVRDDALGFTISSNLNQTSTGWWYQWDSDTTWRCPQKVFKLESLITRVSETARERRMQSPPREIHKFKLQIGTH